MKKGRDKMDQSWEQNSNYRKHFLVPKKRCMLHGLVHTKYLKRSGDGWRDSRSRRSIFFQSSFKATGLW